MLKHILSRPLRTLYKVLDKVRGNCTYVRITIKPKEFTLPVTLANPLTKEEKTMSFKVHKWEFESQYRFSIFNKQYFLYDVFCCLPEDMDKNIQTLYKQTITVPKLLSWVFDEESQLQAVVGFFLDIKESELIDIRSKKDTDKVA